MAAPVVALVLVSHSEQLSRGVAEVAAQMAPDVLIVPAGGTGDGRIGTGVDVIEGAIERALEGGRSAVVLTDLGSAALSAETVLELADPTVAARVRIVDAPFVEGAVESAVVAQTGADLSTVVEAAEDAATTFGRSSDVTTAVGSADEQAREHPTAGAAEPAARTASIPSARGTAVLRNRLGLHARPAAQLARTVGAFDALVTVNGVDARSVLALVGLGATGGQEVVVAATGPQARHAVNAVVDELENGFGEA
jgi:phosphoenolpyruvate---glycerone phosphotransferase subunit DhaM